MLESYRPVTAECDEVKLTLALSNLVENAIKYNVAGGWVQVTLDADHKFFYVTVDDSGIGIPEEYQDKIFERFYRVDKAQIERNRRNRSGTVHYQEHYPDASRCHQGSQQGGRRHDISQSEYR